jgi:hypothetical protein
MDQPLFQGCEPNRSWISLLALARLMIGRNARTHLESLGYDYAANAGVPGHHIFGRGRDSTERTHLVHVVEFLGEEWRGNLALRGALRRDAGLRRTYLQVKERAAAASPEGRVRYNELKGPFLAQVKARLKERPNGVPAQDEERQLLAHPVTSRQRNTAVAFGAKQTLTEPRLQKAAL